MYLQDMYQHPNYYFAQNNVHSHIFQICFYTKYIEMIELYYVNIDGKASKIVFDNTKLIFFHHLLYVLSTYDWCFYTLL